MTVKKEKVLINDKMVEGVEIAFNEKKERWNEYLLDDGTILKMKLIVTKVVKTEEFNKQNEPIYSVQSQNIIRADVPEKLKRKGNR